jgi:hypothetical protein
MMERILIEVKPDGLDWGVFVNGHCLGTTKSSCDADFHANFLFSRINGQEWTTTNLDLYPQDRERLLTEIETARKTKK